MKDRYVLDKHTFLSGHSLLQDLDLIGAQLCNDEYNEAMYRLGAFRLNLAEFMDQFEPDMGDNDD